MEENFENWESPAPLPDMEAELKKMRKNLRRRNWKIVLTSVLLVIAILIAAVEVAIPAMEQQYWDPTVCTYLEDVTDLELTMVTYNELFGHGKHFITVDVQKQGFADYSLNAVFVERETMTYLSNISYRTASLTKGELHCPPNFLLDAVPGIFVRSLSAKNASLDYTNKQTRKTLNSLPDYIQIYASVTFPEDLSMEQLLQLTHQYPENARFLWAVLRNDDASNYIAQCGIHLTDYQSPKYAPSLWSDSAYPNLFVDRYNWTGSDMEQHVKSMLQFSADQVQKGTGISPNGEDASYYLQTLEYMEENGIKTYGAYVIASPQTLLDMMEDGTAAYIRLLDARIGL